ncbi:glutamate 2,3-aminomutase [Thermodesulfitimonas autotrophica]|uniref:glutamate 2,3-aminomutase n=1 Tax=Thermodesulfitimonas autotrophica TaxID=1894989 RepID=UPI002FE36E23
MMVNRCPDTSVLTPEEKRRIALERARELKSRIADYLTLRDAIPTGFAWAEKIGYYKARIIELLGASASDWEDWRWQMRNRISDAAFLAKLVDLPETLLKEINEVAKHYRWAISPYYAAVVAAAGPGSPVWRQAVPSLEELQDSGGSLDPMAEELTSPAPGITRRYPDRLIINVTNVCAMYCRHCQRRRNIGEVDRHQPRRVLEAALDYIRSNPEIRDVLVTGGDALLLPDHQLDWLLGKLHRIPHVEIKRLGTRTPVTLPQRITEALCAVLIKYPPIYLNTQFNHPLEVTPETAQACDRLVRAGVVLGNQAVLLRHINNDPFVMRRLSQELLKIRVRPYYLFHAKEVRGTRHFITSVEEGLEIMEQLRGYTSGLAVPTYIINAPGGLGKTPVTPGYILDRKPGRIVLRTWEKRVVAYPAEVAAEETTCAEDAGRAKQARKPPVL